MKYTVMMGSGAMIYIPSFIKTGSGIQKLIGVGTQNKEIRPKIKVGITILRIQFCFFSNTWNTWNNGVHYEITTYLT
jgi:hypothetical protein